MRDGEASTKPQCVAVVGFVEAARYAGLFFIEQACLPRMNIA